MVTKEKQKKYHQKWRKRKNKLKREADILWQFAVLKKYGKRCEVCGEPTGTAHHFFPKGSFSQLRYDIDNGVPLCVSCHFKHHQIGDPTIHQKIISKRGLKWYKDLTEKSKKLLTKPKSIAYYKERIKELQNFLKNG